MEHAIYRDGPVYIYQFFEDGTAVVRYIGETEFFYARVSDLRLEVQIVHQS